MMKKFKLLLVLLVALGLASDAAAQQEREIKPTQVAPATERQESAPTAAEEELAGEVDNTPQYYEEPTVQKFSQLYWAISKLDPTNDTDIDNFLMINECDIYREYAHNEFEWKEIREAGRQFVMA